MAVPLTISSPLVDTARYGTVAAVDGVATYDAASASAAVFLINRSADAAITVSIDVGRGRGLAGGDDHDASYQVVAVHTLADADPYACNTRDQPGRVDVATDTSATCDNGVVRLTVPPCSWTAVELATGRVR